MVWAIEARDGGFTEAGEWRDIEGRRRWIDAEKRGLSRLFIAKEEDKRERKLGDKLIRAVGTG